MKARRNGMQYRHRCVVNHHYHDRWSCNGVIPDEQKQPSGEKAKMFHLFLFLLVSTVLNQRKMKAAMIPAMIMVTERTKQTM